MAAVCRIRAVPNSSRTEVAGRLGDAVKIKLNAAPEDGRANAELLEFLADRLGVSRRSVTLMSGEASRDKRVGVEGLTESEVYARLGV